MTARGKMILGAAMILWTLIFLILPVVVPVVWLPGADTQAFTWIWNGFVLGLGGAALATFGVALGRLTAGRPGARLFVWWAAIQLLISVWFFVGSLNAMPAWLSPAWLRPFGVGGLVSIAASLILALALFRTRVVHPWIPSLRIASIVVTVAYDVLRPLTRPIFVNTQVPPLPPAAWAVTAFSIVGDAQLALGAVFWVSLGATLVLQARTQRLGAAIPGTA